MARMKHANSIEERVGRSSGWRILLPLTVAVVGLSVYLSSFEGAFLFDDAAHILHNHRMLELWPPTKLLSGRRPVVDLTLAINHAAHGFNVRGYHAVNVAVHILAALTLYGIVRRTLLRWGRRREASGDGSFLPSDLAASSVSRRLDGDTASWLALVAALIWVVHPLQTQSVTYLIQRAESLMGLFYLLTIYCVIRGAASSESPTGHRRAVAWYAAAVVACALGMGSKAVMVTAPVMVLVFDRTFLAGSVRQALRQRWGLYACLAATWGVMWSTGVVRGVLNPSARVAHIGFGYKGVTPVEYVLTQFGVLVEYLKLSVWPRPLCLDYTWPVADTTAAIVMPAVLIAALLAATVWGLVRKPWLGFLGLWFFLILAPTSSFIPIKDTMFEHRMYLPTAAIVVLFVVGAWIGFSQVTARTDCSGMSRRATVLVWIIASVAILGIGTVRRNLLYQDAASMWRDVTAKRPDNARAYEQLGTALMVKATSPDQGQLRARHLTEAVQAYRRAVQIDPDFASAHVNLANLLSQSRQFTEAAGHYREALRLNPNHVEAGINLAHALKQLGRTEESIEAYRTATRMTPRRPDPITSARAHLNLGSALGNAGDLDAAIAEYREALRLWPEYDSAHFWWGMVLERQGKLGEAVEHFRQTLEINPRHPRARRALDSALSRLQRSDG